MAADHRVGVGLGEPTCDQPLPQTGRWQQPGLNAAEADNLRVAATSLDQPEQKMAGISTAARTDWQVGILGNHVEDPAKEVRFMGSAQSAHPPVVRVSGRAQAELRTGEALVFDWTSLAFCCTAAGEISLRPTPPSSRNARRPTCRSGPGTVRRCSPTGGPTRCWSGETSRSTAGAAWASDRSPPRYPPTSGCARRSGARPEATAGKARLPVLMLRLTEAQQELRPHL